MSEKFGPLTAQRVGFLRPNATCLAFGHTKRKTGRAPPPELRRLAIDDPSLGYRSVSYNTVTNSQPPDVASNLGGVRSIKLPTLARATFRWPVRLSQRLEVLLYAVLHG